MPEHPDASFQPDRSLGTRATGERRRSGDLARWLIHEAAATAAPHAYLLKQVVGRGGFGEVWEAQQSSLGRTVAIKRLRDDLIEMNPPGSEGSAHLTQLFEQEAVTTALLDHPNIVPIYDLGRDSMGNPLLAMKLVRGVPWSDMLKDDFKALGIDEFLAKHVPILIDVAQAVAFAHARGIIHRDIKPAQVMVGDFGEVLLMDWGLAVVFQDGKLEELRRQGLPVDVPGLASASNPAGTVSFMAPEQTLDTARVLGPWTDIYLLSGCLYWLLTGVNPHPGSREVAYREARSGYVMPVAERAPGRSNPEELVTLAQRGLSNAKELRPASAKEFVDALRGFLSGRTRRKESERLAREAAAELDRAGGDYRTFNHVLALLENAVREWPANPEVEPLRERALAGYAEAAAAHGDLILARVQAERIAAAPHRAALLAQLDAAEAEKARQRRQRRLLGRATAALGAAVLVGAASFAFVLHRKNAEETKLRTLAETRFSEAEAARRNATRARNDVEAMNKFMLEDFRERLSREDPEELVLAMADQSLRHYKAQTEADLSAGEVVSVVEGLLSVADLYTELGRPTPMLDAARAAVAMAKKSPETDAHLKDALLARTMLAEVAALEITQPDAATVDKSKAVLDLARKLAEAKPDDRETIDTFSKALMAHAEIQHSRGEVNEGAVLFEQSLAAMERAAALHPDDDGLTAEKARVTRRYARSLDTLGRAQEATPLLKQVVLDLEKLAAKRSDDPSIAVELIRAREELAAAASDSGGRGDATQQLQSALALATDYAERYPTNILIRRALVDVTGALAEELTGGGEMEAGIAMQRRVLEMIRGMAARADSDPPTQMKLASALHQLSTMLDYSAAGDGLPYLEEAVKVLEEGAARYADDQLWQTRLSNALRQLGDFCRRRGDMERARRAYEEGGRIVAKSIAIEPGNTALLRQKGRFAIGVADIHMIAGRFEQALAHLTDARTTFERLVEIDPTNTLAQRELAQCLGQTATLLGDNVRREEAVEAGGAAADILRRLAAADPADIYPRQVLTRILVDRSLYLLGLGRLEESQSDVEEGIAIIAPVRAAGKMDNWWYLQEAGLILARGRVAQEIGDLATAHDAYEASRLLNEEQVRRSPVPDSRARLARNEALLCDLLVESGATDSYVFSLAEKADAEAAQLQAIGYRAESIAYNRVSIACSLARASEKIGDDAGAADGWCRTVDALLPYLSERTPASWRAILAEAFLKIGRRDDAVAEANYLISENAASPELERLCNALGIAYPLALEESAP